MSRIKRVEVQEFAFELPDLGFDAGGFDIALRNIAGKQFNAPVRNTISA